MPELVTGKVLFIIWNKEIWCYSDSRISRTCATKGTISLSPYICLKHTHLCPLFPDLNTNYVTKRLIIVALILHDAFTIRLMIQLFFTVSLNAKSYDSAF